METAMRLGLKVVIFIATGVLGSSLVLVGGKAQAPTTSIKPDIRRALQAKQRSGLFTRKNAYQSSRSLSQAQRPRNLSSKEATDRESARVPVALENIPATAPISA